MKIKIENLVYPAGDIRTDLVKNRLCPDIKGDRSVILLLQL